MDRNVSRIYDQIVAIVENEVKKRSSRDRWGTATSASEDGVVEVLVDGGEESAPFQTVSNVHVGDRVLLSIDAQSRMGTVKGNYTDPAASDSEVKVAVDKAELASEAADAASRSAAEAQESADAASGAAAAADQKAVEAAGAASAAQQSADDAATAASNAQGSADDAATAASNAWDRAGDALAAAGNAQRSADEAKASASSASTYANAALDQLGLVQDVAGILSWASEHGSFQATSDTSIQAGKVYFVKDGNDYTPVVDPQASELANYYELNVDDAMGDFVMSHLAVTQRGLWVLPNGNDTLVEVGLVDADGSGIEDAIGEQLTAMAHAIQHASGYKMLLSSDGAYVYDDKGLLVTKFGEDIEFSSLRSQYIGNEDAYIVFTPARSGQAAQVTVGGNVKLGSSKTLSQVLATLDSALQPSDVTVTQNQTATGYDVTIGDSTFSLVNGDNATVSSVRYVVGNDGTTVPQSGWQASIPDVPAGAWLWTRVNYSDGTYAATSAYQGTDGTSAYSYVRYSANADGSSMTVVPMSDTLYVGFYSGDSSIVPSASSFTWSRYVGAKGDAGPRGKSVTAVREQWYLSTSDQTPTGGSWSYVPDEFVADGEHWYWRREEVAWDDDGTTSTTHTTAVLDRTLNQAYARIAQAEADINSLDGTVALKANASDVYTKEGTEALLEVKANKDTLISEINASADAVRIKADRVDIEGAVTIGSLAPDVTEVLNALEGAAADAAGLLYDHTWSLANGVYTFEAHAYRGGVEVTDDLPGDLFTWLLRTEEGDTALASGKVLNVPAASAGYRASVVGGLEESLEFPLVASGGGELVTAGGEAVTAYMSI